MARPYCERCNNTGDVDCHCGGDLCVCGGDNGDGTNICPACDGDACDDDLEEF